ncbi:hypothetical protein ACOMHN_004929 [Nucella lapillus]
MAPLTSQGTLLLLFLLLLSPYLSSSMRYPRTSRRFPRRRFNARRRFCNRWMSSGLFVPKDQVHSLQTNRTLNEVFLLESTQVAFPLGGSCGEMLNGSSWEEEGDAWEEMMPACNEGESDWDDADSTGTILGCCRTMMQVEFPQTVTSVLTRQRHQVLQFAASSQLVHTGRCEREGKACVLGGRCTTIYRIQWLLVRGTPLTTTTTTTGESSDDGSSDDDDGEATTTTTVVNPDSDLFVPAMVPNHCQCVFT